MEEAKITWAFFSASHVVKNVNENRIRYSLFPLPVTCTCHLLGVLLTSSYNILHAISQSHIYLDFLFLVTSSVSLLHANLVSCILLHAFLAIFVLLKLITPVSCKVSYFTCVTGYIQLLFICLHPLFFTMRSGIYISVSNP